MSPTLRHESQKRHGRQFPEWLKRRLPEASVSETEQIIKKNGLHTVCSSAQCPNRSECFSKKKATFMILGDMCTRGCSFCSVHDGLPQPPDKKEPMAVASAVASLGLKHVVITSVTRDDLADGGSCHFESTVRAVRKVNPSVSIEVLIPDFQGHTKDLDIVCLSGIHIMNHNIETVPRLYSDIRPQANYARSLSVLEYVHDTYPEIVTKSGLMVGLGESSDEIQEVLRDLHSVGCSMVTIGQYLQPQLDNVSVKEYVHPDVFEAYKEYAHSIGISNVSSAPFVRSSYNADLAFANVSKDMV